MKCFSCKSKVNIPGDCHISCINPPAHQGQVEYGGDERYAIAAKMAEEEKSVVRCIWPGCGFYPISFDGNTVFGCYNYKKEDD